MYQAISSKEERSLLEMGCAFYSIDPERTQRLGGFENILYLVDSDGEKRVLRFSPKSKRSLVEIIGEAELLGFLGYRGLSVPRVYPDSRGRLSEELRPAETGQSWFPLLFSWAPGRRLPRNEINDDMLGRMGGFLGRFHRLAQSFVETKGSRPTVLQEIVASLGAFFSQGEEAQAAEKLIGEIRSLGKTTENYGLIHCDFHCGNFHYHPEKGITLFDWDDAQYSWLAHDIAMVLFYLLPFGEGEEGFVEVKRRFQGAFLPSYLREYPLPEDEYRKVPVFLRLRELELYGAFTSLDRSSPERERSPFELGYMKHRRKRILEGVPLIPWDL